MKVIGSKKTRTTLQNFLAQEKLILDLEALRPKKKKKGMILKFKTWDELKEFQLKRAIESVE
jgi:hypothetical protein